MKHRLILGYLGYIILIDALAIGGCGGFAFWHASNGGDPGLTKSFFIAFGVSLLVALGLIFLGSGSLREKKLLRRETVAIASFAWAALILIGSLPYLLFEGGPGLARSLFESTSGFTTTGSTIFGVLEDLPAPILLWRAITQWLGGLGILMLFAALLPSVGAGVKSLIGSESSAQLGAAGTPKIRVFAQHCWTMYCVLTVACAGTLYSVANFSTGANGISVFDTILYSLTTVSTGGFAPHSRSVGHFESWHVEALLCVFMLLSSISVVLLVNIAWGRWKNTKGGRTEAIAFLAMTFIAIGLVSLNLSLSGHGTFVESLREAFFPVMALSTSAGFGTADYDGWPLLSRILLGLLMCIGGCSGSTAGGFKVIRALVGLQVFRKQIRMTYRPNLVLPARMDAQPLTASFVQATVAYLMAVAGVVLVSTLVVAGLEPQITDLTSALGAVLATFFNMGPGFGIVGPTDNFGELNDVTIFFLAGLMLLGRLEIFVLAALFTRQFWRAY